MKKICVYSTSNDAYLAKCVVSLLSVRRWNPGVDLFVIAQALSQDSRELLADHGIGLVELRLTEQFYEEFEYPIECYYLFAGPEYFARIGYEFSVYVDGDVYCNGNIAVDWDSLDYYAGVSVGTIPGLLKRDLAKVQSIWDRQAIPSHRIQSGVLYFNNFRMEEVGLLDKIVELYDRSIKSGVPRRGDDSLFSLFQLVYPEYVPLLLDSRYNCIVSESRDEEAERGCWIAMEEQMISDCIFFHFTLASPKPWEMPNSFPCYTAKYFRWKWLQRMLDVFSEEEIARFFPEHCKCLSTWPMRYYWWGARNVGDLLTPYFLERACGFQCAEEHRIDEKEISRIARRPHAVSGIIALALSGRSLFRRSSPTRQYCLSAGSIMRLCSSSAVVYGSGVRTRDQLVQPGVFRFVRGPLTRERVIACGGECPPVYGDPGLLLPFVYRPSYALPRKQLAVVPHFTEYTRVREIYANESAVTVVDMGCGDLEKVIEEIVAADKVVSSSLHGIIFANAYGIPVRWIKFSDQVHGDDTKYHDYFASVNRPEETYIDALEFAPLSKAFLCDQVRPYALDIDLERLRDEMFFDCSGLRRSSRYRC